MRKLLATLMILMFAPVALAQNEPYEENANNQSSQQLVAAAVTLTAIHPLPLSSYQAAPAPVLPGTAAGIGPSSNTQPGDYGYSAVNDLRQLNF